ncbi:MAG: RNA polymerase factor sigma-54 [Planctomycetota bacterium]
MKLEMRGQLRMEQKMKLAPHMIQSMEILQLPIMALLERIEQELNSNPVLEIEEPSTEENAESQSETREDLNEKDLIVSTDNNKEKDFERLANLDDEYKDYMSQSGSFRVIRDDGPDKKLELLKNTVLSAKSLHEYLTEQWGLVEAQEAVKKAGSAIIDYIDKRGYLTVRLEQLHNKDNKEFGVEDLNNALKLVQKLDPAGVGARNLKECLLIQMEQGPEDMSFEKELVSKYKDELLENHLPEIAKKMHCDIEQINQAIENMSKLDTSPGLQISQDKNHAIKADVIVEQDENGVFTVQLADSNLPNLRVNRYYSNMIKNTKTNEKTKEFLQKNIRSARWIIEAILQRQNTLLKVSRSIVKYQQEFFEKGQLFLRPLPMSKVAGDVGVHLATVSRAVSGKYVQCYWGIIPLRKFFSGGMEDENGTERSWEAIRGKLQKIIDHEDKSGPLSDDKISKKLTEEGIPNLARRTVAKYRKLMNIPPARLRRKY